MKITADFMNYYASQESKCPKYRVNDLLTQCSVFFHLYIEVARRGT